MGSDIEQSFVVLMEVHREVWHWHWTDYRLVKFGAGVEYASLITTHQSRNRDRWSGNSHVAIIVAYTIYLYLIYVYVVISCVNWTAFYRVWCWAEWGGQGQGGWVCVGGVLNIPAVKACVTAGQGITANTGGGCQEGVSGNKMDPRAEKKARGQE